MGFRKGTLTLAKYRVIGTLPDNFRTFVDERLKLFAFRELSVDETEKSVGWTSFENVLDTNFEYASYSLADYLVFSLRIDRRVVSPSLLKLKVLEAERQTTVQRSKGLGYREKRSDIRERVHLSLLKQTPPTPSIHEVCWNVSAGWLLFGSLSEKIREDFEDLFKRTFGLTVHRFVPWDANYMSAEMAERTLSATTATPFHTSTERT